MHAKKGPQLFPPGVAHIPPQFILFGKSQPGRILKEIIGQNKLTHDVHRLIFTYGKRTQIHQIIIDIMIDRFLSLNLCGAIVNCDSLRF